MTGPRDKVSDFALLGIATVAWAVLLYGVANGEPAGCANDTCKAIQYYYSCDFAMGTVEKQKTCLFCAFDGRCDGGENLKCISSDTFRQFAPTTVTEVCDCAKVNGVSPHVEASGNFTGTWNNSQINRYVCQPNNTGSGI